MKNRLPIRFVLAATLAMSLAGPARADRLPCEGVGCVVALPFALAYIGILQLGPTPLLVKALDALDKGDHAGLKALLEKHPQLTRLTPEQSATLEKMEAAQGERYLESRYVLTLSEDDAEAAATINGMVGASTLSGLEFQLRRYRRLASAVDNGYVLLTAAARRSDLEAMRMLLDAGVRADSHRSGALSASGRADIQQLLLSRGASRPAAAGRACPCDAAGSGTSN